MANIIQILPDSLANQIAAGEVIQRPASVLKELVENSIDAQSTQITINIKDAGKTLIQIIDNGIGMSRDDARLAFERHATSKIKNSDDLFNIQTKGFRGEALASIAAVAQVELKTKRIEDSIGTFISIEASKINKIESANIPDGSNFSVKNLFYNIPARRKFLKADNTEFYQILNEFYRIVLAHENIAFTLIHNDNTIYKLQKETRKERILNVFDSSLNKQLINVWSDAGFIKITGFVGHPEYATKNSPKQYFFVNNRYMKSTYFHKAINMAYEKLITNEQKPNYFIFFEIDPQKIDVNIHPTKTEINFEEANSVFQLILSTIRKALTDFDLTPSIDFENTDFINIPLLGDFSESLDFENKPKKIINPSESIAKEINFHSKISSSKEFQQSSENLLFNNENTVTNKQFIVVKEKFLLTPVKSGLMIINIKRAFKQIKYEEILGKISNQNLSIESIYPVQLRLQSDEINEFESIKPNLEKNGFKFEKIKDFSYNIVATPPYLKIEDTGEIIKNLIKISLLTDVSVESIGKEEIAQQILNTQKVDSLSISSQKEAEELLNKLFGCQSHQYTFDGKLIINLIETEYMDGLFS